jgi:hypothetical protein
MNIVQLHDKVRFWTDHVGSARYDSDDIDIALNTSINQIQKEKYDKTKLNHRSESFEKTQAVRDELSEYIVLIDKSTSPAITLSNETGYVSVTNRPTNYRYLLSIKLVVGSVEHNCMPLPRNRKNVISKNSFRKITDNAYDRCYYEEVPGGIKVYHPWTFTAPVFATVDVKLEYLKKPTDVYYGTEFTDGTGAVSTASICTLTPSDIDSTVLKLGDEFTTANPVVFSYGAYVQGFVNPEMNSALHEEIAQKAAINLMIASGNVERLNLLRQEIASV